ncbi:hypothetical protein SAMN05443287_106375 [Micromonospora phaseoli]|uniref:Uncharacterized protein n=1 Tax=Micromonospora phaseoli TaxID=1144548 RepID=A0A1H7AXZ3_9ACTN|nr:hypothetical protein [Micromonospora phaseoli]PZV96138.1 hypothetical protein CLV64_10714 [Micromonospora phaseoli]GIJ79412.1 hypothetical protein Xph01_38440 [Micromonospora phaseoli]SEJ69776.1 hypothetical protein SAMN05443287_106375 [Micromonospora phaseoli]
MSVLTYVHVALRVRLAELRGDRGDSPVPTAVIIFGLVAVAMAVTAAALGAANDWMDKIPAPQDPVDD